MKHTQINEYKIVKAVLSKSEKDHLLTNLKQQKIVKTLVLVFQERLKNCVNS